MTAAVRHFACTQCGKCCDRSPEVQLSEAAALADIFVFRLMFRLYALPRTPAHDPEPGIAPAEARDLFYQKKRLLAAHAAGKYPAGARRDDKIRYLVISALPLQTGSGACNALQADRCGIYDRRPLACRTLPFHYSRVDALVETDLRAFVATPGYGCDTGDDAAIVLEAGRIVDPGLRQARAAALALAERERPWKEAILRRVKAASSGEAPLPSLREIEANALFGATTMAMAIAWQIAADSGLIAADTCSALIAAQLATIERALAAPTCLQDARQTLVAMRAEYLKHQRPHCGNRAML